MCGMEDGVEFHSTPFVFLTDTFTGNFLCGGDLGRVDQFPFNVLYPKRTSNFEPILWYCVDKYISQTFILDD